MRYLSRFVVVVLLTLDYGFPWFYRQLKYGDTWIRVELMTGRTSVLVNSKGWVSVKGVNLPPPSAGLGAFPPTRTPRILTDPRRWCTVMGQVEPWCT